MAHSEVSICNAALNMVGGARIMSLTEESEEAAICNERYFDVRDTVLQMHPWSFTIFRITMVADAERPLYEYTYQYVMPTSPYCLRVLDVYEVNDWRIENRLLLCNASNIRIRYVGKVTDPIKFSPLVSELIAARLAMEIAYKLSGQTSLVSLAQGMYDYKLKEALDIESKVDNMPRTSNDLYRDTWIRRSSCPY